MVIACNNCCFVKKRWCEGTKKAATTFYLLRGLPYFLLMSKTSQPTDFQYGVDYEA